MRWRYAAEKRIAMIAVLFVLGAPGPVLDDHLQARRAFREAIGILESVKKTDAGYAITVKAHSGPVIIHARPESGNPVPEYGEAQGKKIVVRYTVETNRIMTAIGKKKLPAPARRQVRGAFVRCTANGPFAAVEIRSRKGNIEAYRAAADFCTNTSAIAAGSRIFASIETISKNWYLKHRVLERNRKKKSAPSE